MSNTQVLIAYASRYETTAGTAEDIVKILEEQGINTEIVDLKSTKEKEWPLIDAFDGIIVASGIRISRWMKEPQKFIKKHKDELNKQEKILGLFVSCGTCLTDPEKANKEYLVKKSEKLGIKPNIYQTFGPILDFSETSRMGWFARGVLKSVAEKEYEPAGYQIDYDARNDLRDMEQIRNFSEQFAMMVKQGVA